MDESEAMDLHSQTRHRTGTGLGLRPGTGLGLGPGQPLATTPLGAPGGTSVFSRLTHADQRILGRNPSPSPATNTATNTAHDPLNQVRGGEARTSRTCITTPPYKPNRTLTLTLLHIVLPHASVSPPSAPYHPYCTPTTTSTAHPLTHLPPPPFIDCPVGTSGI